MNLWRVAVQPGKPLAFGRADVEGRDDPVLLFGLPGNPVSASSPSSCSCDPSSGGSRARHASPAGRPGGARGAGEEEPRAARVPAGHRRPGRGRAAGPDGKGRIRVRLAGGQGSHVLSALAAADALAVIPEPIETAEAGARSRSAGWTAADPDAAHQPG